MTPMAVQSNASQVKADINRQIGLVLLRMAVTVQSEGKKRLNVLNPPPYLTPSKEGEWLRKRTGHGQAGLLYEPTTPEAVGKEGAVRVGWQKNVFYMALWGDLWRKRKGLLELVEELRPQLAAIGGKGK